MRLPLDHRHTLASSYVGYVTQAIVNNLGPLMFLIWHGSFGISFSALGALPFAAELVEPREIGPGLADRPAEGGREGEGGALPLDTPPLFPRRC